MQSEARLFVLSNLWSWILFASVVGHQSWVSFYLTWDPHLHSSWGNIYNCPSLLLSAHRVHCWQQALISQDLRVCVCARKEGGGGGEGRGKEDSLERYLIPLLLTLLATWTGRPGQELVFLHFLCYSAGFFVFQSTPSYFLVLIAFYLHIHVFRGFQFHPHHLYLAWWNKLWLLDSSHNQFLGRSRTLEICFY